jgi:hypothetical protein
VARRAILCEGFGRGGAPDMFDFAWPAISPETIESFFSLAIGFAVAGLCATGYRLFSKHFPSFRLLEIGPTTSRFASIPLLMFSAPFIIMRNTLRGRRIEGRRAEFVMVATVIAGLWSLMSGTVVVMAVQMLMSA